MADARTTLGDLEVRLRDAQKVLAEREREEQRSRSLTTDARNQVNAAQKEIDLLLDKLKKDSPRDTVWGEQQQRLRSA